MILFFVWTDVQLVNCINVKCNYYKNENAELIVYKRGRVSERLLEIVRRKGVFSNTYILSLPGYYDEDRVNKMGKLSFFITHIQLKKYLSCKVKAIVKGRKYEKFLVASFWSETLNIYTNIRKANKNINIEIVEEGMANYTGREKWIYRAAPSSAVKAWLREIFYCGYLGIEARKKVSCLYLYQPRLMWGKHNKKIKRLPIIDSTNNIVFGIFEEWQEKFDNSLYEECKLIYVADSPDLEKSANNILQSILPFIPDSIKNKFIIKLHPLHNIKEKNSIVKNKEGIWIDGRSQPIENILFPYNITNKILIVNHSSSLLYLKCMLGKEPYIIFIYKIQGEYKKGIIERFDFFSERLKGIFKEPDRLIIPDTMEDFREAIKIISSQIT